MAPGDTIESPRSSAPEGTGPGAETEAGVFRVGSYNVHGFMGRWRRRDVARTAAVIRELQCRAVGLQEVRDSGRPSSLAELEERTGMRALAGATLSTDEGDFGNALLTDCPVLEARRHDLSVPGMEPRGALEAKLALSGRLSVRMIVTHLGLRPLERRLQARALLRLVARGAAEPLVLAGDFNEWWPLARPLRSLREALGSSQAVATFPSRWPLLALDRIWVRPAAAVVAVAARRTRLARAASDHLPVVVTLDPARLAG